MIYRFHQNLGILFSCFLLTLLLSPYASAQQTQDNSLSGLLMPQQDADEEFSYSPKGRRDPFTPLIKKDATRIVAKENKRPEKIKGPLEKFELSQFRLIAILVVKGSPHAMVKAPDDKSYTIKVGEYIGMNEGVVTDIETKVVDVDENGLRIEKSPDRIVVEETGIDNITGKEAKEYRYIVM